jgi:hypothetical protein
MASETPEPTGAESETGEIKALLSQAQALADRVEKLHDGPRKENLKTALSELQNLIDQLESEAHHEH